MQVASGEQKPPSYIYQRQKRSREHEFEEEFNTFKGEMKNMITSLFAAQQAELKKIVATQTEIKQTNSCIQECLDFLTAQNEDLKKKLEQFEIQSRKDKDYITILEDKIEDLQRVNRKSTIELKNVPLIANESKEDLTKMVTCLSKNIHCNVRKEDIKDIYRMRGKKHSNKSSPIVVEFSSTLQKTDILKMCKLFNIKNKEKLRAKHLGATKNEETPIFVSEQLTARGARIHFIARDFARSEGYKFCWTAFGRVYLRKDENSPIILVRSESQVHNLKLSK